MQTISLENGKYTLTFDQGELTARRHGELWSDFSGNKFIYLLFVEALKGQDKKPLTQAEIYKSDEFCYARSIDDFEAGVRFAERHHGITE